MSLNDQRSTIRMTAHLLRRSLGLWLLIALPLIALAIGSWSSWLAGQSNQTPTYSSANAVSDTPSKNRTTQVAKPKSFPNPNNPANKNWQSTSGKNAAAKPVSGATASNQRATSMSPSTKRDPGVVQASHEEFTAPASGAIPNNASNGFDPSVSNLVPAPLTPAMSQGRPMTSGANVGFPGERTIPPQITGSHLGLLPGETATERSLRLMNVITDLEQQIAELSDINTKLNTELKAKEAKLQSGALQFNAARKELSLAAEEFQRLRKANADLREKYRTAERENASLMRSLSPLLKQMLQSDDDDPQAKE